MSTANQAPPKQPATAPAKQTMHSALHRVHHIPLGDEPEAAQPKPYQLARAINWLCVVAAASLLALISLAGQPGFIDLFLFATKAK